MKHMGNKKMLALLLALVMMLGAIPTLADDYTHTKYEAEGYWFEKVETSLTGKVEIDGGFDFIIFKQGSGGLAVWYTGTQPPDDIVKKYFNNIFGGGPDIVSVKYFTETAINLATLFVGVEGIHGSWNIDVIINSDGSIRLSGARISHVVFGGKKLDPISISVKKAAYAQPADPSASPILVTGTYKFTLKEKASDFAVDYAEFSKGAVVDETGTFTVTVGDTDAVVISKLKADVEYIIAEHADNTLTPAGYEFDILRSNYGVGMTDKVSIEWSSKTDTSVLLTNWYKEKLGSLTVNKAFTFKPENDAGTVGVPSNYYPTGVMVTLTDAAGNKVADKELTAPNWSYTFTDLPFGVYTVTESISGSEITRLAVLGITPVATTPATVTVDGAAGTVTQVGTDYAYQLEEKVTLALTTNESDVVTFTNGFTVPDGPFIELQKLFMKRTLSVDDEGNKTYVDDDAPMNKAMVDGITFDFIIKGVTDDFETTVQFPGGGNWNEAGTIWSARVTGVTAGNEYTVEEITTGDMDISAKLKWKTVKGEAFLVASTTSQIGTKVFDVAIPTEKIPALPEGYVRTVSTNYYEEEGFHFEKAVTGITGDQDFLFAFEYYEGGVWQSLDLPASLGLEKVTSDDGETLYKVIVSSTKAFSIQIPDKILKEATESTEFRIREISTGAVRSGYNWDATKTTSAATRDNQVMVSSLSVDVTLEYKPGEGYASAEYVNGYSTPGGRSYRIPLGSPTEEEIPLGPPLTGESVAYGWAFLMLALASALSIVAIKRRATSR